MNDGAQARLLLMYPSQAQAEVKYGAAFFLALKGIFKNRSFPQVRHDRTRCGQHVPKGQRDQANDGAPEHAHGQSQNLDSEYLQRRSLAPAPL